MFGLQLSFPRPGRPETTAGVVLALAFAAVRAGPEGGTPRHAREAAARTIGEIPAHAPAAGAAPAPAPAPDSPSTPAPSPWSPGRPLPIAVRRGHAEFDVPTPERGARTLVIVSSLARGAGPFPMRLAARGAAALRPPALAPRVPRRDVRLKPAAPVPPPALGRRARAASSATAPAPERIFHMMVKNGDAASASNYLAIRGQLRAVGERVQVYVDAEDAAMVRGEVLHDLVTTFDTRIFPGAAANYGQARDVDGDGRFTVLMSPWLTRLAGGRHAVDGYVRGADFDPALAAPFGNRCDMLYLSTALEPGPHLRTVLAHEYTHAVTLCAKAFSAVPSGPAGGTPSTDRPRIEEEGWLDEALAHLVEDLHGFSRSNVDYRVSAFLSQPSRYRLVVEDYYAADLFRSHGNRGATYLFLRWCADRFGPGLVPTLIRSDRRGIENIEAATGVEFAELYRGWSIALFLSGLNRRADPEAEASPPASDSDAGRWAGDFRSLDLRAPFGDAQLAGPRPIETAAGAPPLCWSATGTSSQFVIVAPSSDEAARTTAATIEVSAPPEAELQVTAVPLPADMAAIALDARAVDAPDGTRHLHASVRERHARAVTIEAMAWEPLIPAVNPRAADFRGDAIGPAEIPRAFGTAALAPRGLLKCTPLPLGVPPAETPLVVKLVGIDARGHRVAAWAEVPPPSDEPDVAPGSSVEADAAPR